MQLARPSAPLTGHLKASASHHTYFHSSYSYLVPAKGLPQLLYSKHPRSTTALGSHLRSSQRSSSSSWRHPASTRAKYRSSSNEGHEQQGDGDRGEGLVDAADIWAPEPPTPALGRKRKVAVLIAAAMLEITMTGV